MFSLLTLIACGGGGSGSTSGGGGGGGGGNGGGGTGGNGNISSGPFTAGRTKYVRTDATTEYFQWLNSHWIIYNAVTNRFFVTDPGSNHVFVLDAASETEVGVISVPGAYSLDDSPDHQTIWVATTFGDLYTINPVAMAVTTRYVGSQIGPSGYYAASALVMADGRLALLGGTGGITLDGSANFALWNPTDNTLSVENCSSFMGNIGGISRTPDRAKVILASVGGGPFCLVDEATLLSSTFGPGGFPSVNFRITPDGKYLVTPFNTLTLSPNNYAYVYDLTSLNLVSQVPVNGNTSTGSGFAISTDSKTLFVPNDWVIYAYDLASGKQVGWMPNINVRITIGGRGWGPSENPNLQAVDGTGLFAGPMEEGVGFIDTTTMLTSAVGTQFPNGYANPATGPVSGGTTVKITEPASFGTLSGIYFGSQGSSAFSGVSGPNTYGNFGYVSAMSPPGKAGPTDVYVLIADGGVQLIPEAFSYGPTIVEITPNTSTGEGGAAGIIYGYGFGPVGNGVGGPVPQVKVNATNSVPSSLQVTVNGAPVQVTGFLPYAYNLQSPPFPLQALSYVIPQGSGAADVSVTSSSGTVTAKAALTYLPPLQQFPRPGASLAQGVYDSYRDVYYFTDANQMQVFSKAQGKWLTPIGITPPAGTSQRLWGIALSPNGSKLAVSDITAGAIYVLDASNTASVQTFAVNAGNVGLLNPSGLAISDAGFVYYAVVWNGITGGRGFYRLDTSNGQIFDYGIAGAGLPLDAYYRVAMTADNSRVFFNNDGFVFYVNTTTNTWVPASVDQSCCYGDYELTLSANQSAVEASGYFYDRELNGESYFGLNDREVMNISYVYGAKLSADGILLFQPSSSGIDVLDGRVGNLLNRIALPLALSPNYDALVSDGKDNVLLAITGQGDGIAVLDLSSVTEPPPLPYMAAHQNEGASLITERHSGSARGIPAETNKHSPTRPPETRIVPHITKLSNRSEGLAVQPKAHPLVQSRN